METGINWGDIATWLTGIATIALFVIGFIQIRNERESRTKRENEQETIKKREQAEQISSWLVKYTSDNFEVWHWIAISNQSLQPVYNVIVNLVALSQTNEKLIGVKSHQACVDVVPPGLGYIAVEALIPGHPGMSRIGVEIGFQDKSGKNWVRMPNGELVSIEISTIEHYDVSLPANWQPLSKDLPQDESPINALSKRKKKGEKSTKK